MPTPVAPVKAFAPASVVVPVEEREVTVVPRKVLVPDVCVRLPPIVILLGVPMDVRELLLIPVPKLVDVKA